MSTKFFNNTANNTLFAKLKGIAHDMVSFDRFLAVAGFFRSSGYFKLRKELDNVKEIKILVGINIDDIFRKHNKALFRLSDGIKSKEIYEKEFCQDILDAKYSPEIEEGILQMGKDLMSGKLQMRIYEQKNLHAKFYLCLPQKYNQNSDGWVIMGSSNISESGLGITETPRYELNVAMKDFDDVNYCYNEFNTLWENSIPLSAEDINNYINKTYLGYNPTPYEIYIKVLIDTFGSQVEDDFSLQLPDGIIDLKYQRDAVIQGYQILMQHNGLFLADVVGLGKTMIATMIAKRFIEANGKNTNVLVVFPPALENNWREAFHIFGISKKAQFITNGSLSKILENKDQYKDKEEFDLIIVDEAHGFRNDDSGKYDELQKICKSTCSNVGLLRLENKKVMLLSATPLNNRPNDLLNQILLFQNSQNCTIDGIPNLKRFFAPRSERYEKLMRDRNNRDVTEEVDKIYAEIREQVIDKITVRRTRFNIINDPDYNKDLKLQGIVFPNIEPPIDFEYEMSKRTSSLFYNTLASLCDETIKPHLNYARYRAIEFLNPELQIKYKNAEQTSKTLAELYRVHMVKRLESSFYAFKSSLKSLLDNTKNMLFMFNENKVLISPNVNVNEKLASGMNLDEIIEYVSQKNSNDNSNFEVFKASDFSPTFIELLNEDINVLEKLNADWNLETADPKFDKFKSELKNRILEKTTNPTGKIVLFSESVDTLNYLNSRFTKELNRKDVLLVTSKTRNSLQQQIKENFDANNSEKKDDYNILLTSDVLAEGVNLHRSNVIVNYDSPWNATKLMQRIGRVNRIGSVACSIYNYLFYPSKQGDKEIKLYKNALMKLQGFHSAFGEDSQIYSTEEIVKQFKLYNNNVKDSVDKKIKLLREVRELYNSDRELYHKIKKLPMKCRVMRDIKKHSKKSIIFISSSVKTEFYLAYEHECKPIDFLEAVKYLKAPFDEKPAPFTNEKSYYEQVNKAKEAYINDYVNVADTSTIKAKTLDKSSLEANKFLRTVKQICIGSEIKDNCDILISYITEGIFSKLPKAVKAIAREYNSDRLRIKNDEFNLQQRLSALLNDYKTQTATQKHDAKIITEPQIIISEFFK